MLELAGVRHAYEGRVVLDLERFAVAPGALIAIVGHNGSGKSTLLRLLALVERPTAGEIRWDGAVVSSPQLRPRAPARRRITLVEQRPMLFRGTVRSNIEFGLRVRGHRGTEAEKTVAAVADRLGVTSLLARRRHELSDGEVQRVAVARALAVAPDGLLLDEPVSSADRAAAEALFATLGEERRARGLAICLASHQLDAAYRWADDIRALAEGRLSPVTPENLFRVELPAGDETKHVRVAPIAIAVTTAPVGPAILALPPPDLLVST